MNDYIEVSTPAVSCYNDDEYDLTIEGSAFNSYKNELTLVFKLTFETTNLSFLLRETIVVGSKKYRQIMRQLYAGDDGDIIAVNSDDFTSYHGKTKLVLCGKKLCVDWSTLLPIQSLLGELWDRYHPEVYE